MIENLENLQMAESKLAKLAVVDPVYLPFFQLIQNRITKLQQKEDALSRAQAIANAQSAVA